MSVIYVFTVRRWGQSAYPPPPVKPLAQVLSEAGKTQFHCAESEKFAHVTFFFNGGENNPFPGEDDGTRLVVWAPSGFPAAG